MQIGKPGPRRKTNTDYFNAAIKRLCRTSYWYFIGFIGVSIRDHIFINKETENQETFSQ